MIWGFQSCPQHWRNKEHRSWPTHPPLLFPLEWPTGRYRFHWSLSSAGKVEVCRSCSRFGNEHSYVLRWLKRHKTGRFDFFFLFGYFRLFPENKVKVLSGIQYGWVDIRKWLNWRWGKIFLFLSAAIAAQQSDRKPVLRDCRRASGKAQWEKSILRAQHGMSLSCVGGRVSFVLVLSFFFLSYLSARVFVGVGCDDFVQRLSLKRKLDKLKMTCVLRPCGCFFWVHFITIWMAARPRRW